MKLRMTDSDELDLLVEESLSEDTLASERL